MKYQLVLQWPANSMEDYDTMIEIENILIKKLSKNCEIDGHDAGAEEMNIFIHTDDPVSAFKELKLIIGSNDFWVDVRVAYRDFNEEDYKILWPPDLTQFTIA